MTPPDIYELSSRFFTHSTFSTPTVAVSPVPKRSDSAKNTPLGLGVRIPTLKEANTQDSIVVQLELTLNEPGMVHYLVRAAGTWTKNSDNPQFDLDSWEAFVCNVALPQLFAICKYEQVALTRSRQLKHARFSIETEGRFVDEIRHRLREYNS